MSLPWMSLRQHVLRLASRPQQPVNFFTTSHRRLQYLRHDLPLSNQLKTLRNHRLQTRPQTRLNSSRPNPDPISNLNSANPAKAAKDTSLSARLKRLSKEYGWSAFGVYLALSALDFPFCFLAVRWLGVERIGRYEQAVIGSLWHVLEIPFPGLRTNGESAASTNSETVSEGVVRDGAEAGLIKKENASIWTQLALAYAVHKSLIFFRVPLTAAVTPKVVKTLRGWGWDIAKKKVTP